MPDHSGHVAVVTGGAQGIGQAYATRLAQDGAAVAVVDVQNADATLELIRRAGGTAESFTCDVADPEQTAALAVEVQEKLGACDILVNNAGIYPVLRFEETTYAEWRRILGVNLDGTFLMCRTFVPPMVDRGWGRVINQATSMLNMHLGGFFAYMCSKAGVVGLTRALASEVGEHGVTVNAIAPSLVRTPGTLRRERPATAGMSQEEEYELLASLQAVPIAQMPEDLAGTLSFLASNDAAFITAQTIHVDGGIVRVG